jgi:hypothetical protein
MQHTAAPGLVVMFEWRDELLKHFHGRPLQFPALRNTSSKKERIAEVYDRNTTTYPLD